MLGMPRAPLPRPNRTRTYRPAYETGVKYPMRHALRPDGVPDRFNNRPTLCGTRAHTSPVRFEPWLREIPGQRTCRTCRMIAERFPAIAPPDAPNDLARARHLFGRLRAAVAQPTSHTELRTAVASVLAQLEPAVPPPTLGDLPDPPAG